MSGSLSRTRSGKHRCRELEESYTYLHQEAGDTTAEKRDDETYKEREGERERNGKKAVTPAHARTEEGEEKP